VVFYANGSNHDAAGAHCRAEAKIAKRITDSLSKKPERVA